MEYRALENIGVFIHTIDLEITSYVNKQLAPFQLTSEQNLIMALLWEREGISQNEITARLNKDKAGVARMIVTLEKKGFIRREVCQSDRRAVEVYLTEKGKILGKEVTPINQQIVQLINEGLTQEEIVELRRILTKVRQNVNQK
ncbi:MarR family winged helix-turn-helix transcriptional regulator [Bacillus sp. S/N-304-OC-R1]|uniref:MarR family winged helix-turn-helix transcriptional regulator n=1 Tax=Bacillus sp. S/N-304-OC-R1 TaxID=2758034 RepID=UPI001C8D71BF|nr:MarR family transcriptional regulator [Bacillus sp. S/N-304-OC-R1]MBY0121500.1 MarR family transcriptional regulator [Bacillus sp. S/N-304-OC-R1]